MTVRIGVIYTGGTIGMSAGKDGLTASSHFSEKFFQILPQYQQKGDKKNHAIDFEFIEYDTPTDSSHANLQLAVNVYNCIQQQSKNADAWLVLMGSDTLPYIAACLSYLLHKSTLSVIVSGAMKPLTAPQSDAILNLQTALKILQTEQPQGVNVVFGGELLPGVRCTKLYATLDKAIINTTAACALPLPRESLELVTSNHYADFIDFDIRVIRAAPSLHVNFVRNALAGKPDAVLIQCYGAGTAPAEESQFAQAVKALADKDVPLFAISQTLDARVDFSVYAASAWLEKLGIVRCGDMNLEAAYTKLWYLLNHDFSGARLGVAMQRNLCGEISRADPLHNST